MNSIFVHNIFAAVSDKSVLDPLLAILDSKEARFWATEGTAKYIKSKGFAAKSVVSGFDFDGRVKSLDKVTFARILTDRSKKSHSSELQKLGVEPFDLVVVDLYKLDAKNFPESMDIGGQALIRAAIKNFPNVALAFDEKSIRELVGEIQKSGGSTILAFRKKQATRALHFIAERCQLEAEYSVKVGQRR